MESSLERVVGECSSAAIIGMGVGVGALEAAISVILRVREEYGVECSVLLYTSRTASTATRLLELFRDFEGIARLYPLQVPNERPGCLEEWLRKRVVEVLGSRLGWSRVVVVPTPGSRRIAAALGMAGVGALEAEEGNVDIVHIDFYWGLWTGLPYPLVPRILEPLYILNPVHGRPENVEPVNEKSLRRLGQRLSQNLPPIRRRVAEFALSLNVQSIGSRIAYSRDEVYCDKVPLEIRVESRRGATTIRVENWCSSQDWSKASKKLREVLRNLAEQEEGGEIYNHLLRASGLERIILDNKPLRDIGKPVIIDTNLVYWGIHNDCWEKVRVIVPYAVQAEVLRRYTEALKAPPSYMVRQVEKTLMDILAYHQLQELLQCNQHTIIPSPPPPADTAIPSIDPLLLTGKIIATGDHGAYELWRNHPSKEIAEPKLATTKPIEDFADTVYAILQLAALTQLLPQQLQRHIEVTIRVVR